MCFNQIHQVFGTFLRALWTIAAFCAPKMRKVRPWRSPQETEEEETETTEEEDEDAVTAYVFS